MMTFVIRMGDHVAPNTYKEIASFDGIPVNATTLRSLLEVAKGPIALVLDEKKDEISVIHPYDF